MSSSIWLDAVCIVCIKSKEEAGLGKNLEAFYMFDCWNVVSYVIFKESEILIKYVDDFCCFQIYLQHVGVFLQVKLFRMLWGVHIMLPRKYCWNRMARRQMFGALELYSTFYSVEFPHSGRVWLEPTFYFSMKMFLAVNQVVLIIQNCYIMSLKSNFSSYRGFYE